MAFAKAPGILKPEQRTSIIDEVLRKQQREGDWSTSSLVIGTWQCRDGTPLETGSDGYGTGLVAFVLQQVGVPRTQPALKNALSWLTHNQDKSAGLWLAYSLNKQRDRASDVGRFMIDDGISVPALSGGKKRVGRVRRR